MTHDPSLAASTHPYDSLTPDIILDAMEEAGFAVSGRLEVFEGVLREYRTFVVYCYRQSHTNYNSLAHSILVPL